LTLLAALTACGGVTARQLTYWRDSLALFEHALQVTQKNYLAHYHAALAWLRLGRVAEAKAHLLEALQLKPDFALAHYSLGTLLDAREPQEAIEHLEAAARFDPSWGLPRKALGGALARLGRVEEAIAGYASAARLAPDDAEAQLQLGVLFAGQGKLAEAAAHYRAALRLRPDSPEALNNLAWLLSTAPQAELRNGPEAVRLAERACALTRRRRAIMVGTLAAAYAEAGRFDAAAQTAQEAIGLAEAAGENDLAERNRALRQLYLEHRPFRAETP
jgi:tetratricopeptide (TPR) repeat protein